MPSSDFAPLAGGALRADAPEFRPLAPAGAPPAPDARAARPFAPAAAAYPAAPGGTPPEPTATAPEQVGPAAGALAGGCDEVPSVALEEHPAWHAGVAAGRAAAQADLDAMEAALARSLEDLATFQRALRTRYERELLQVALGVARKVVQHELQERPEIWLGMIRAAVQQAVERERIVVRVPPALAATLRARLPRLRAALEEVKELEIADDPALPAGGCIIESRWGEADIGVESQLAAAERALLRAEG